jgi:hypothetical protein
LWENHTFLKTDEGEIIDFSPLYQTLGAKHQTEGRLTEEQINEYRKEHTIQLNQTIPLNFDSKSKSLLRIGVKSVHGYAGIKLRKPETIVYLDLIEFDKNKKKYVDKGYIELRYSGNRAIVGSLKKMTENNIIEVSPENPGLLRKILKRESPVDSYVTKFLRKVF